jgi:hypothetical protein
MRAGVTMWAAGVLATIVMICGLLGAARAEAAVEPGYLNFEANPSTSLAGGHPDVTIDISLATDNQFGCGPCVDYRTFKIHWPTGFIGNPHVAPKCTLAEFNQAACPVESQIGTVVVETPAFGEGVSFYLPLVNMETRPDQAGQLGFVVPAIGSPTLLDLTSRTDSDYGLDATSSTNLRLGLGISHFITELWGVPAAPVHDVWRFAEPLSGFGGCIIIPGFPGFEGPGCPPGSYPSSPTFAKSTSPERPFLQNPTTCGVPLTMTSDAEYYGGTEVHAETDWPETIGCNQATFSPSLVADPTTGQTDTPSGLDIDLHVPQTQSPDTPAPSEMRSSFITLPPGLTLNPGASDGKIACPEFLSAIGTLGEAHCPEFSKVGTLTLDIAALPAPIPGAIYILPPKPGEPYRALLAADGFATHAKLITSLRADPRTGQVTMVLEDLPQSPLQEFQLHIFGSDRGLLATPTHCDTYPVEGEFVPWNTALTVRKSLSTVTVNSGPGGSPCPGAQRPFDVGLGGGSSNSTAGRHAPYSFSLTRPDGHQNLSGLEVRNPSGFAATLKGVPYCPESAIATIQAPGYSGLAEQANPACPASSQIGTVVTGAGAGTHPLYSSGKVYLAGPYKGAPLSMVASIPAVSGPYDLGNVAVRAAISVDPRTAQVSVKSDPLPQIFEGIPLRARSLLVDLDRPDFALNPTNCDPFQIVATAFGAEGGTDANAIRYQAANCALLPYRPKLGLKLRGNSKRRGHPSLQAVLRTGQGEANTGKAVVSMPKTLLLDNAHIGTVCTRVQYAEDACPPDSIYGTATAESPLLDQPLSGPVYLRSSDRSLPNLVVSLKGQFDVELVGAIDSPKNGGMRTTFSDLPDVPVGRFVIDLEGGAQGLLINSKNLCKSKPIAMVRLTGQNGAQVSRRTKLRSACGKAGKSKRKRPAGQQRTER